MVGMAILQPVVALAAWTMVMWFWLYGTRNGHGPCRDERHRER